MQFAVPVAFFPNASNHLQAILPNKILKSKKNPQVRFLSLAEVFQACDVGFWECDAKRGGSRAAAVKRLKRRERRITPPR
jgi:hypothetical protein